MSSETLNQLIDAFKAYQNTTNLETLRNLTPADKEEIRTNNKYSVSMFSPKATKEQLYKFEQTEAALIEAINRYIDDRIKQFTKSID